MSTLWYQGDMSQETLDALKNMNDDFVFFDGCLKYYNKKYMKSYGLSWIQDPYNLFKWIEVTKTLGDVKGVVSVEDRQLLKIVHKLSDEAVDEMISEYQKQYKLYLKNSKMYGKEKWR